MSKNLTLLELLEKRSTSQTELAALASVSLATVNRWANKEMRMSVANIARVQALLKAKALLNAKGWVEEWIPDDEGEI